jgi:hypothetical protein
MIENYISSEMLLLTTIVIEFVIDQIETETERDMR